jgi:hypothetical protein
VGFRTMGVGKKIGDLILGLRARTTNEKHRAPKGKKRTERSPQLRETRSAFCTSASRSPEEPKSSASRSQRFKCRTTLARTEIMITGPSEALTRPREEKSSTTLGCISISISTKKKTKLHKLVIKEVQQAARGGGHTTGPRLSHDTRSECECECADKTKKNNKKCVQGEMM